MDDVVGNGTSNICDPYMSGEHDHIFTGASGDDHAFVPMPRMSCGSCMCEPYMGSAWIYVR